ncbi:MAG: FtsX-like permease family protein [Paludibacter sp.]|nr:FtsX-like permease family protein [Paludibacter sp.]
MTSNKKNIGAESNSSSPLGVRGYLQLGVLFKTAFRSLIGNGLKTWLNVFVLSFTFVLIIFMQGLLEGWNRQAMKDSISWEIAGGQYWSKNYDPYDPFSIDSSAAVLPATLKSEYDAHQIEPVLLVKGTIYPNGRMQGVLLKGIRPDQHLLALPTNLLKGDSTEVPVIMGAHMARQADLKVNDMVTLRWRDVNGTFEAIDIRVAGIFTTSVPAVDVGQIWLPLAQLQKMTLQPGASTIIIKSESVATQNIAAWPFKDQTELTKEMAAMIKAKSNGYNVLYTIFFLLALIAIFDTQTLSIFRRQREIGTLVALGMTQRQVVRLFTLEGTMNAVLAILVGAVWGLPLFIAFSTYGIHLPMDVSSFGIPMADRMYPAFTPKLILGTMSLIIVVTALVSYFPARKIARMNPTEAIRGKAL